MKKVIIAVVLVICFCSSPVSVSIKNLSEPNEPAPTSSPFNNISDAEWLNFIVIK